MLSGLMSSLSSIIRSILDSVSVDPALIRPYIDVICDEAILDIAKALEDNGKWFLKFACFTLFDMINALDSAHLQLYISKHYILLYWP